MRSHSVLVSTRVFDFGAKTLHVELVFFVLKRPCLCRVTVLQVVPTLPVLSSDDDSSDEEKSQSSGDEPKGDGRASPPSVSDAGPVPTSDSQGGVPAKNEGSAPALGTQDRVATTPLPQGQEVFFTTTDFYLVLRLHHVLAERLAEAKKLCREAGLSRQTVVASSEEVGRLCVCACAESRKVRIPLPYTTYKYGFLVVIQTTYA